MAKEKLKTVANQNGEILQNASGADFQAGYSEVTETRGQSSVLETMLDRADVFRKQQAQNDNNGDDNGGDYPGPANFGCPAVVENAIDEENSLPQVYIDINEVAKKTHISKKELAELCSGNSKSVYIPTDLTDLTKFITVSQGHASTAGALAKRKILPPETRTYFLKRAQEYGYLWLKGEVQLGNEIRKIVTRMGKRTDLEAANDNEKKQRNTANLDKVLTELRTKKEILTEDYGIGYTQARQLTRLTDYLVERELKYALANNDTLSRNHALSFLNLPPEPTDEEKAEADVEEAQAQTKAKFNFETIRSAIPFESLKKRKLKNSISYCSLFSCFGTCEYYLEQHGFVCKVASEYDPDVAKYYVAMNKMRSKYPVEMIQGDFKKTFKKVVKAFRNNSCCMVVAGIPCVTFTSLKAKKWMDQEELTLVFWFVQFVKATRPKYIVTENAKQFFGFSFPMDMDLTGHPLAKMMQAKLKGRTIGQYLRDELEPLGYTLNFAIEDGCFYGTSQSRVRSIMLASKEGVWKWPCAEKFAKPLLEAIYHLPSSDDGDSGIKYHEFEPLHSDPIKADEIKEALEHTPTGCRSKDNDPKYQLSGFGCYAGNGSRKFWDRPSNTIDSSNGSVNGLRTIHPGRPRKDGTYSDARPLTLLEVILVNGLPQNYKIPEEFENRRSFVRHGMGQVFLPRLLERICLEIPVGDDGWEEMDTDPE